MAGRLFPVFAGSLVRAMVFNMRATQLLKFHNGAIWLLVLLADWQASRASFEF